MQQNRMGHQHVVVRASYQIRKLWVTHALGIPGTFYPAAELKETTS